MPAESGPPAMLTLPRPGTPPRPAVPRPERFQLDNGLRVLVVPRRNLPQVAARLVLTAGSAADPAGAAGTASLVGALLTEGTAQRSALDLNDQLDSLGAALSARVGHDFAEIDLTLLAETLAQGLNLLAEVVTTPTFPEREVERLRAETIDALEARHDEPANVADDHLSEALFGPTHPYGRLAIGTIESVRTVRQMDLVEFHNSRYRPDGCVLVMAGDFDPVSLRRMLEDTFGAWAGSAERVAYPSSATRSAAAGALLAIARDDVEQAEIRIAGPGLPRTSPLWIPAAVANYILGGSTITGRLGANLREDKGWTYGVRSGFAAGVQPAGWAVETAVDAGVTEQALAEIDNELSRMSSEDVGEEELARAKEALILSLPRAFETSARVVARLATIEAFGLEEDYWQTFPARIAAVTAKAVREVAARFFEPRKLVRVTVAPPPPDRS